MNEKFIKLTKFILDIMFFGGLLTFVTLPASLRFLGKYYSAAIHEYYFFMLAIFGISGVFGIIIISQLRKIMGTVKEKDCFVHGNVASLHIMARSSLCITAAFLVKIIILPTPATGVIVLTFFIAALFSQVLSYVFAQAVDYKEENDLTI